MTELEIIHQQWCHRLDGDTLRQLATSDGKYRAFALLELGQRARKEKRQLAAPGERLTCQPCGRSYRP